MRTVAVMNQKGGCGKTTISINLASAMARLDRRVLLIDLDPQSHASVGLGIEPTDSDLTSYELLMDPNVRISDATQTVADNLDLIMSNTVLSGVEQELADRMGREERLLTKVVDLPQGTYDIAIIDCPPSVGLLTFNALIACKEVLIPVDASFFSFHGLTKLRETIEVIENELKREFKVHVVCNNLDTRTHFSKELLHEIEKFHSAVLAETFISHTVRLKEAAANGVPIFELDRQCKASRQFLALARELVEQEVRMEAVEPVTDAIVAGPARVETGVLFTLDVPQAKTAAVTGEFTNWSREGIPMQRDANGVWKTVVDIRPGEYEYRFIVDGVWMRDPNNRDFIRNEFGQENSLLIV